MVSLEKIIKIKTDLEAQLATAKNLEALNSIHNTFLSKKGLVAELVSEMRALPTEQKPEFGKH